MTRAHVARLAPLALFCASCSAPIRNDPGPRQPWQMPRFAEPAEVLLDSDAGAVDGAGEVRVGANVLWRPEEESNVSLAVNASVVRGPRWWSGMRVAGRWSGSSTVRPWVEAGVGVGTGAGASRAVSAAVGAEDRNVAFALRSVRFEERELLERGDTVVGGGVPSRWDDYTDAEVLGRFLAGTVSLEVLGGLRLSDFVGQSPWASARIAVPIGGRIELRAGGGTRPERHEHGERGGSFVSLGVAIRPVMPAPAVRPPRAPAPGPLETAALANGGWSVSIRMPAARSVEISGDLTDWSPIALTQSSNDPARWTARLSAAAGVYLVTLRVDGGAWRAPPGLPVVPDGFGGQAGLLELQNR